FSSRRRHTRFDCDWSSDVCSSDLTWCGVGLLSGRRTTLDSALEVCREDRPVGIRDDDPRVLAQVAVDRLFDLVDDRLLLVRVGRSEERRVGKERSTWVLPLYSMQY